MSKRRKGHRKVMRADIDDTSWWHCTRCPWTSASSDLPASQMRAAQTHEEQPCGAAVDGLWSARFAAGEVS